MDFAFIVDGVSQIDQPRGFGTSQPDDKLDLGEVALQGGSPARGRPGRLNGLAPTFDIVDDAVNAVGMGMIPVVAELILDVQEDQDAGGHADCESGDIDERIGGMPAEVAQSYAEVILEHLCLFRSVGVATVAVLLLQVTPDAVEYGLSVLAWDCARHADPAMFIECGSVSGRQHG